MPPADAKYANRNIKSKGKYDRWAIAIGLSLIALLILIAVIRPQKKAKEPAPQSVARTRSNESQTSSISGSAFLLTNSGSEILRGMQIFILDPERFEKKVKAIDKDLDLAGQYASTGASGFFDTLAQRFGYIIESNVAHTGETDIEGRYAIEGVEPGNYLLFCQSYTTVTYLVWIEPVSVSHGNPCSVDLSNSGAYKIINVRPPYASSSSEELDNLRRKGWALSGIREWAEGNLEGAKARMRLNQTAGK